MKEDNCLCLTKNSRLAYEPVLFVAGGVEEDVTAVCYILNYYKNRRRKWTGGGNERIRKREEKSLWLWVWLRAKAVPCPAHNCRLCVSLTILTLFPLNSVFFFTLTAHWQQSLMWQHKDRIRLKRAGQETHMWGVLSLVSFLKSNCRSRSTTKTEWTYKYLSVESVLHHFVPF